MQYNLISFIGISIFLNFIPKFLEKMLQVIFPYDNILPVCMVIIVEAVKAMHTLNPYLLKASTFNYRGFLFAITLFVFLISKLFTGEEENK